MKQNTIPVFGQQMHYVEQGQGPCTVFLHGIPTSSILWRNIIPKLAAHSRCIAPDLIGMGLSDKPDIEYTIHDHINYFSAFVEALGLSEMTLVMHGWGSVIGFEYAKQNPEKINGMAFSESHIRPIDNWNMLSLPVQQMIYQFSNDSATEKQTIDPSLLMEIFLQNGVLEKLPKDILAQYQAPFANPASCRPLETYLKELPKGDEHSVVFGMIKQYAKYLCESPIPKCLLFAVPGFITPMESVAWAKENISNITLYDLGDALHFAQETKPDQFAKYLCAWYIDELMPSLS